MSEANEIVNRVAKSGLIPLDMGDFFPKEEILEYDLADNLWQGIALKEKDFREFIKNNDWSVYSGKHVAIHCSANAIVPSWAYMLLTASLKPHALSINFGNKSEIEQHLMISNIKGLNTQEYQDARIVVKGCGDKHVSEAAWVTITSILQPVAKTLMFGEPCSTVPIYKKPRT